jgi:predicted amidohydrolase YtcJ
MDVERVLRRGLVRVGGCFATALDGAFGSEDAALHNPYTHLPTNKGILYYNQQAVNQFVRRANRAGLQVAVHAIGDAAFDQAVQAFSEALADHARTDHRHIIIHACMPTERGLEKAARLALCIAAQPAFNAWPLEPAGYLTRILGARAAPESNRNHAPHGPDSRGRVRRTMHDTQSTRGHTRGLPAP